MSTRCWKRSGGWEYVATMSMAAMAPTLNAGDDILVDLGDTQRLRDGIYVLRADEALVVKRLALHPAGRRVTVQSDNPAYPDWPDCDIDDLRCIGRVIWAGRKIG